MTKTKPKIYPAEFKESSVKLAIESNRPRLCFFTPYDRQIEF